MRVSWLNAMLRGVKIGRRGSCSSPNRRWDQESSLSRVPKNEFCTFEDFRNNVFSLPREMTNQSVIVLNIDSDLLLLIERKRRSILRALQKRGCRNFRNDLFSFPEKITKTLAILPSTSTLPVWAR